MNTDTKVVSVHWDGVEIWPMDMRSAPLIDGSVSHFGEPTHRRMKWDERLGVFLVAALVYIAMGGPLP
jgi:hypothetical protein